MSPAKFTQAFIVLLIGFTLANTAHAQTETVLYNFTGGSDGGLPFSNLTSNGKGNFYGTASEGGLKYGERYLNHILSASADCGKLGA
jgi:hypothetical protein